MSANLRWSAFYWGDWLSDAQLHRCSLTARGLWIEMLCLMHDGEPRGYLTSCGLPTTPQELAQSCRTNLRTVVAALAELEARRVFSRDENGAIYSRRMVGDELKRSRNVSNGKLGGNPKLIENNRLDGVEVNPPLKAEIEKEIEIRDNKERVEAQQAAPPTLFDDQKPSAKRATRIDPKWQPSEESFTFCQSLGLHPPGVLASFRDYWIAASGSKATKLDWEATFRNWCRNDRNAKLPAAKSHSAAVKTYDPRYFPDFHRATKEEIEAVAALPMPRPGTPEAEAYTAACFGRPHRVPPGYVPGPPIAEYRQVSMMDREYYA